MPDLPDPKTYGLDGARLVVRQKAAMPKSCGGYVPGSGQAVPLRRRRHDAGPDLSIRDTPVGVCRVIAVSGKLDLATADILRHLLIGALSARTPWLIVELSGVPFCDSSGLRALLGAHHKARAAGSGVLVAVPRPPVRAVLQRLGLHQLLPIHDTVKEAIRAVAAQVDAAQSHVGHPLDEQSSPRAVAV
jgi:anti-sigma B factor antagonist